MFSSNQFRNKLRARLGRDPPIAMRRPLFAMQSPPQSGNSWNYSEILLGYEENQLMIVILSISLSHLSASSIYWRRHLSSKSWMPFILSLSLINFLIQLRFKNLLSSYALDLSPHFCCFCDMMIMIIEVLTVNSLYLELLSRFLRLLISLRLLWLWLPKASAKEPDRDWEKRRRWEIVRKEEGGRDEEWKEEEKEEKRKKIEEINDERMLMQMKLKMSGSEMKMQCFEKSLQQHQKSASYDSELQTH